jgi:hypothetical protein
MCSYNYLFSYIYVYIQQFILKKGKKKKRISGLFVRARDRVRIKFERHSTCMKTVRLEWQGMMRRIRLRRIEHSGPPGATIAITMRCHHDVPTRTAIVRRGPTAPPPNEQALGVGPVALEQNDVAGVEALLLDVAAPAFGEDVALATVPIGVAEAPALAGLVLEVEQEAGVAAEREVLLGVLFGDDEAVELADVAGGQWLLEHGFFFGFIGFLLLLVLMFFLVGRVFGGLIVEFLEILGVEPGLVLVVELRGPRKVGS